MRNGLSKSLIERILGGKPKWSVAELEVQFPQRNLPESAMVTRFAPSPTGFLHLGGLYQMLIDYKLATQSHGVFILRIEDTDTKREVEGTIETILDTAKKFGIVAGERPVLDADDGVGDYGPYLQSKRKDIYHSVVAELLSNGRAYPCFLLPDEMEEIRKKQTSSGYSTGIYGEWAKWRNAKESEIEQMLDKGMTPSIRLYSLGSKDQKIFCKDAVRGSIAFPENDEDIVLIKSNDGLPTYHFAHLIDDHFMRTTHVIRAEEWLPSLPLHIQLFKMMNWTPPVYIHTSTLDTIDSETGKQRKLSKRKDPTANVANLISEGYPEEAVLEYLFNIVNSSYEEEKAKGKVKTIWECDLKIKKIPTSGALFDPKKLEWWCKEFIASLSVPELERRIMKWIEWGYAEGKMTEIETMHGGKTSIGSMPSNKWSFLVSENNNYLKSILSIERDDPKRIRKDFITWKQTLEEISYFFSEPSIKGKNINKLVLEKFLESFDFKDDKDLWWTKITKVATEIGIKNGDAAMALRVTLTGRTNTPDLYSIMHIMEEKKSHRKDKSGFILGLKLYV